MGVRNVGIVFSPTLNIPTPVFSLFLGDFADIFETPVDPQQLRDFPASDMNTAASNGLTPEDIRSPRKQMFSDIPTPSYNQSAFPSSKHAAPASSRDEQLSLDMGFTPLQPSYNDLANISCNQPGTFGSNLATGLDQNSLRPRDLGPGGDVKSKRRESSMLMLGPGQSKTSTPMMRSADSRESLQSH